MKKDYELTRERHDQLIANLVKTDKGKQIAIDAGIINEDGSYTEDVELILSTLDNINEK